MGVEGAGECLPELLVFADDRIVHVERDPERCGLGIFLEGHAALTKAWRERTLWGKQAGKGVFVRRHLVEVALPREDEHREGLGDDREIDLIDKRQRLARQSPKELRFL